jgi:hypothetical protein
MRFTRGIVGGPDGKKNRYNETYKCNCQKYSLDSLPHRRVALTWRKVKKLRLNRMNFLEQ